VDANLRIWLKAPLDVRAGRIAKRENKPKALAMDETSQREECERERYLKYYDIDIKDLSVYDLIIDSSKWNPEEISEIVQKAVKT
jgi:cytidylate kinase